MADDKTSHLYILLIISHFFQSFHGEKLKRLVPEQLLLSEHLYHNESRTYRLTNLEKECSYELRISYPATIPTIFEIKLTGQPTYLPGHRGRKLLNIEKVIFKNTKYEQFARVTAIRTGLPLDSAKLKERVIYNIVLEKLYFGLPFEVWKTAIFIFCTLMIVFSLLLPKLEGFFKNENMKSTKSI